MSDSLDLELLPVLVVLGVLDATGVRALADREIERMQHPDTVLVDLSMARNEGEVLNVLGFGEGSRPSRSSVAEGLAQLRKALESEKMTLSRAVDRFYSLGANFSDWESDVWFTAMTLEHLYADAEHGVYGTLENVRSEFLKDLLRLEGDMRRGA